MVLFNLKQLQNKVLSKVSALNYSTAFKKNCQGHPTNFLVKQSKTNTPRLHATYPMTFESSSVS